jgi:hypothetical protein
VLVRAAEQFRVCKPQNQRDSNFLSQYVTLPFKSPLASSYVGNANQCIKVDYDSKYAMRYVQVEYKGAR